MPDAPERVDPIESARDLLLDHLPCLAGTHYPGCQRDHWVCALLECIREIDRLRAAQPVSDAYTLAAPAAQGDAVEVLRELAQRLNAASSSLTWCLHRHDDARPHQRQALEADIREVASIVQGLYGLAAALRSGATPEGETR